MQKIFIVIKRVCCVIFISLESTNKITLSLIVQCFLNVQKFELKTLFVSFFVIRLFLLPINKEKKDHSQTRFDSKCLMIFDPFDTDTE